MSTKTVRIWFAILSLGLCAAAHAQMETRGIVIRVIDRLVYIDLGRRDGVQPGELFDIVSTDVLTDPLSGDTLAVSPTSVGALRVVQVFDKMSLGELLQLQAGEDPMLMKISRTRDPERLVRIEALSQALDRGGSGESRLKAVVPGLYQLRSGQRRKGLALMGAETVLLATGVAYRLSSNDWMSKYRDLSAGLAPSEYEYYYNGANDRRRWSNRFFWLSGAVYAYNLFDVFWMQARSMGSPSDEEAGFSLGAGLGADGQPGLRLVHRF